MKRKIYITIFVLFITSDLFAQTGWNEVWNLQQVPFQPENSASEFAKVIAGFDTDEDGFGEFITGYTDFADSNYILMYEATGDNTYELVWYFKFPYDCDSWFGATVGDLNDNGKVELVIGLPTKTTTLANPPRIFVFEWNGVQGENKYGREQTDGTFDPTISTHLNVEDNMEWFPYSMEIEDVDKDGVNELVLGVRLGSRGREVLVASITGEFTWFSQWNIEYNYRNEEGGSNFTTVTGDLDNDGQTDIVEVVWSYLTMRFFEATGTDTYEHVNDLEKIYQAEDIDYGAVDAVRILDANGDGKNELFMAGADDAGKGRHLFLIQNVTDISKITANDVVDFYYIPDSFKPNGFPVESGLRNMDVGDPDHDGKINLMICGAESGKIYDLEYKGEGDLADSSNWELKIAYNSFTEAEKELGTDSSSQITPRHYYGSIANDMDGDGLSEYVFCNYSTDKSIWPNDFYVSVLESESVTGVQSENTLIPEDCHLLQNYPNPFNPNTNIKFGISEQTNVKIVVYNILGKEVATILDEVKNPGNYIVNFDGSNLTSGIYFYRLQSRDFTQVKKMTLLK